MTETNPYNASPKIQAELLQMPRMHLLAYRGSIAHGMYIPSTDPNSIDDVDLMAIYSGELETYLGLGRQDVVERFVEHFDLVGYELRKFFNLLLKCNPNVLGLLWQEPDKYLHKDKIGEMLIENRELFSSKAAYHSFSGYAYSQLKRMTSFHDKGEGQCCKGETFHSADCSMREQLGRGSAKKFATGFMGAKRKSLVEQFGYDTKNAAHCLRLLRMGIEFLREGCLQMDRTGIDAEWLLRVKKGELSLAEVQKEADDLFAHLKEVGEVTRLPEQPDRKKVEELLMDCLSLALNTEIALRTNNHLRKGLKGD